MPTLTECRQLIDCLINLGFPSKHHFIKALQDQQSINLNEADEYGYTPLRIAIQKQEKEAIKLLYSLEPNPAYLDSYDEAMLQAVVFDKKDAFKNFSTPNHRELISCFHALYSQDPTETNEGFCFGLSQMYRRALFAGKTEAFWKQLKNIKVKVWPVVQQAMREVKKEGIPKKELELFFNKVREKLKNQFPYHIWTEVHAFSGYYTKTTFVTYCKILETLLEPLSLPGCFAISTERHSFIIEYRRGKWLFIDTNYLEEGEKECSIDEVTTLIFSHYSEPLIIGTQPFISPEEIDIFDKVFGALKTDPEWMELRQVNKEQIGEHLNTLLHTAIFSNDIEIVEQCIYLGAVCNKPDKKQFTPLWKAIILNNDLKVVQLIIKELQGDKEKINQRNKHGLTALHCAVSKENLDIVKELLKALDGDKKKINQTNREGATALYCAAQKDSQR